MSATDRLLAAMREHAEFDAIYAEAMRELAKIVEEKLGYLPDGWEELPQTIKGAGDEHCD